MNIDWNKVAGLVEAGATLVQEFAPLAAVGGPDAAAAATLAAKIAGMVSSAASAAGEAATVIATADLARIQAADALVRAQDVQLSQDIAAL
jgi:ABC-type cobalamin transport system ATPase subunit